MIFTNLLANMVVLTLQSTIPTNTPAFQEYAFHTMFTHATNMLVRWDLDLPKPVTSNSITSFQAVPYPPGVGGKLVFTNRFSFSWTAGGLPNFDDESYSCFKIQTLDVRTNEIIMEQWLRATNLLTASKALQIAESAIRALEIPLDVLNFKNPLESRQFEYVRKDGKICLLPYYHFYWRTDKAACTVDISGIVGKVVYFHFTDFTATYLWFPKPLNYLEMLGLPENAVFVRRYFSSSGHPQTYELLEP